MHKRHPLRSIQVTSENADVDGCTFYTWSAASSAMTAAAMREDSFPHPETYGVDKATYTVTWNVGTEVVVPAEIRPFVPVNVRADVVRSLAYLAESDHTRRGDIALRLLRTCNFFDHRTGEGYDHTVIRDGIPFWYGDAGEIRLDTAPERRIPTAHQIAEAYKEMTAGEADVAHEALQAVALAVLAGDVAEKKRAAAALAEKEAAQARADAAHYVVGWWEKA